MTPPISWFFDRMMVTQEGANKIVKDLTEQERKILLEALHQTWSNKNEKNIYRQEIHMEQQENLFDDMWKICQVFGGQDQYQNIWYIDKKNLLNKPNMTPKDKEWMQKAIDYLVAKKMDTLENLNKLDAIVYMQEYIEIWGVKRTRNDVSIMPNGKTIYQYNKVTYCKRIQDMINDLWDSQWLEIPLMSSYEASLKALPGNYIYLQTYEWWNILGFIVGMPMNGFCESDGTLQNKDKFGYLWSASAWIFGRSYYYSFWEDNGGMSDWKRSGAFPIRLVLKQS